MAFKACSYLITLSIALIFAAPQEMSPETDTVQVQNNWLWLFDGTSLDHWQSSTTAADIPICWEIKDGELISLRTSERAKNRHASLVTKKPFSNFELEFEFKLETPSRGRDTNSGIKIFVYPDTELGLEYQLYATNNRISGPHAIADLYDILSATGATLNPFDQWNSGRIVSRDKKCEHWLNGVKVLEYERGSETFRAAIAKSKFSNRDKFGELDAGHIMLQDHGGGVRFRNIKIREF
ncbi:DUF1080 domain-containing protein [candidate division KSB1 bacterium]|nr:DUF1080 domain-containing protein [candidate division KSB1 bacterium]